MAERFKNEASYNLTVVGPGLKSYADQLLLHNAERTVIFCPSRCCLTSQFPGRVIESPNQQGLVGACRTPRWTNLRIDAMRPATGTSRLHRLPENVRLGAWLQGPNWCKSVIPGHAVHYLQYSLSPGSTCLDKRVPQFALLPALASVGPLQPLFWHMAVPLSPTYRYAHPPFCALSLDYVPTDRYQ